ncbi:MAG TPA: acetyl-CoA carboxylase biotin carboxyl carrier protein subunit [Bacteroidales bacterium]|nr:acetyl-CoA carboxylase biotin carboxyl carrier protein subunit [Bacteroidales bacterium]
MSENNQHKNKDHHDGQKRKYRSLVIDGTRYRTQLTEKFRKREKWDNPHKGKIYSEFPGTVVKVDVEKGDEIEKGDRLYIYDAMKMKNRAYSPVDGTVTDVRIKEDEVIKKGQLLFVIE